MNFNKIITCLLSGCLLLGLCSFEPTDSSNGFDEKEKEQFDQELEALDPLLDAKEEMGDDYWVYEESGTNELSEEDIEIISPYVYMEDNHIKFDESIYVEDMKINYDGFTPSDIEESTGEPVSIDPQINYAYYVNNAKLNYVKNNMTLMNDLVDEGEGEIEDGVLKLNNSGESKYKKLKIKRSVNCYYSFKWYKISIDGEYAYTIAFEIVGFLANCSMFTNIYDLFNSDKDALFKNFINAEDSILSNIPLNCSDIMFNNLSLIVSSISIALNMLSASNIFGFVRPIISYLLHTFIPNLTKGLMMIIGGRGCHYGGKVEIGFLWSSYDMYDYGGY